MKHRMIRKISFAVLLLGVFIMASSSMAYEQKDTEYGVSFIIGPQDYLDRGWGTSGKVANNNLGSGYIVSGKGDQKLFGPFEDFTGKGKVTAWIRMKLILLLKICYTSEKNSSGDKEWHAINDPKIFTMDITSNAGDNLLKERIMTLSSLKREAEDIEKTHTISPAALKGCPGRTTSAKLKRYLATLNLDLSTGEISNQDEVEVRIHDLEDNSIIYVIGTKLHFNYEDE